MRIYFRYILVFSVFAFSCESKDDTAQMNELLDDLYKQTFTSSNSFNSEAKLIYYDSLIKAPGNLSTLNALKQKHRKASVLLELGREQEAIDLLNNILTAITPIDSSFKYQVLSDLALSWLRLGERANCTVNHSAASCIFPIGIGGVHSNTIGSEKAIAIYTQLLEHNPGDLESKWLMNIAYMTINGYPSKIPPGFLIPDLNKKDSLGIPPFFDAAPQLGLAHRNMAGGSIIDDFDNDGYLDIIFSGWSLKDSLHYFKNNADGSFTDYSDVSGLSAIKGGLNMIQADYNNDGFLDIFLLRGAWKGKFGCIPNSLLRNNGDGTFSDITIQSGLLSFHPTQTAVWCDFNNDGWLDIFIGNESVPSNNDLHPCELYLSNKNGTFTNIAAKAKVNVIDYVKGVTAGDFNNDGWSDIFISTMTGNRYLLKNEGIKNGYLTFTEVTNTAGLGKNMGGTFTTWFWDYDNDGWLDIFTCDYEFSRPLSDYAVKEALHLQKRGDNAGKPCLFHNNRDGSFSNNAPRTGLFTTTFSMGGNYGDLNNDGFPDAYLGTGNISYKSVIPNKMFLNLGGKNFADITSSSRTGNLQKGHGVSMADLDNDGDEDIFIEVGGAFPGDAYQNALYVNNLSSENNWIGISLTGVSSNRSAIGAKLKITISENGTKRNIYQEVNSGGSFGSNPLRKETGLASATIIDSLEIKWPNNSVQVFTRIKSRQFIKITEGMKDFEKLNLKPLQFKDNKGNVIDCAPVAASNSRVKNPS